MEYIDGPPVTLKFQAIEHMWLRLPNNDLIWQVDESERGQYRADQLLQCADTLFLEATRRQQTMPFRFEESTLIDRRMKLAREIMRRVAPFVSCDVDEIVYYVYDQAGGTSE